jgi:hypothetical protein
VAGLESIFFPARKKKAEIWVIHLWNLYTFCKSINALPCNGGVYEQPAKLIEVFNVIRNVEIERDNNKREIEELKNMNLRRKNG